MTVKRRHIISFLGTDRRILSEKLISVFFFKKLHWKHHNMPEQMKAFLQSRLLHRKHIFSRFLALAIIIFLQMRFRFLNALL